MAVEVPETSFEPLLRAQRDLATEIAHATTIEAIAALTINAVSKIAHIDLVGMYVVEGSSGDLVLTGSHNLSDAFIATTQRYPGDSERVQWLSSTEAFHGKLAALPVSGRNLPAIQHEGIRALSVLPLRDRTRLIGCLNVGSRELVELPAATQLAIESLAVIVAAAMTRALAQHQALANAERHRWLFERMYQAVMCVRPDGVVTDANAAACRAFGREPSVLIGMDLRKLPVDYTREDGQSDELPIEATIRTGQPQQGVALRMVDRETQQVRWLLGDTFPIHDAFGTLEAVQTVFSDVTDRKLAEQRYRTIVQGSLDGFMVVDATGTIIEVNDALAALLGIPASRILGQHAETHTRVEETLKRGHLRFERTATTATGAVRHVEISATALPGNEVAEFVRDITDRKRAAEELEASEEQLRHAQKMEAVGRLAGGIAHDFNNLLTIINASADLALTDLHQDDPLRADLDEILKAGQRAANLTRQLLTFSRREVIDAQPQLLDVVLCDLQRMLRRLIGEDIGLEMKLSTPHIHVLADRGQLEQVIVNLAVNARDAMTSGGTLTIATDESRIDEALARRSGMAIGTQIVRLSVTDTGIGMDEATRSRAFDPFFTTKGSGGTGLGLSTVYGIVKQSKGHVEIHSSPGHGARLEVLLPVVTPTAASHSTSPLARLRKGHETILLVEDEAGVRQVVKTVLEGGGYTVITASNGAEALEICEHLEQPIDLLFTDLVMPKLNGRQLADRALALRPTLRVMFMSGYLDDVLSRDGVLTPGVHFIPKPLDVTTLRDKVRVALDAPPAAAHRVQ